MKVKDLITKLSACDPDNEAITGSGIIIDVSDDSKNQTTLLYERDFMDEEE